jgi:uncharacterized small protein (DUF1192 family)
VAARKRRIEHSVSTISQELIVMDVPKGQRIAELRREIERIEEENRIYRSKGKHPGHRDRADNERRIVRLEEIRRELAALRPK